MLRIGTVVMGVADLRRAVTFWTQALGYVPRDEMPAAADFAVLVPAAGATASASSTPATADRPMRSRGWRRLTVEAP